MSRRTNGYRFLVLLSAAVSFFSSNVSAQSVVKSCAGVNGTFRVPFTPNNRERLRGLIDTGATNLLMCADIARRLGLDMGVKIDIMTSIGRVLAHHVHIDTLAIGPIVVRNVTGAVHPKEENCEEVLIGMSALRKLRILVLRGEQLILVGK
jgi:clan AA aspartic protease (TIGR02281 family)